MNHPVEPVSKQFDLLYTRVDNKAEVSVAVFEENNPNSMEVLGPFSGPTMGKDVVAAMMDSGLGFAGSQEASQAYVARHFQYMHEGKNRVGMPYPCTPEDMLKMVSGQS